MDILKMKRALTYKIYIYKYIYIYIYNNIKITFPLFGRFILTNC